MVQEMAYQFNQISVVTAAQLCSIYYINSLFYLQLPVDIFEHRFVILIHLAKVDYPNNYIGCMYNICKDASIKVHFGSVLNKCFNKMT